MIRIYPKPSWYLIVLAWIFYLALPVTFFILVLIGSLPEYLSKPFFCFFLASDYHRLANLPYLGGHRFNLSYCRIAHPPPQVVGSTKDKNTNLQGVNVGAVPTPL